MTKINVRRKTSSTPKQTKISDKPEEPLLPTYAKEDDILADASKDLEEPFFEEESKKKKKHWIKKFFLGLLIFVLLGGAGGGVWYLVVKKKIFNKNDSSQNSANTTINSEKASTIVAAIKPSVPDAVVYAYKAEDKDPYTLYYRPAVGGDRKEVQKIEKDFAIIYRDVVGQTVVFGNDSKIYASSDGGRSYKSIYTTSAGGAISSLKLSSEGDRLAVGLVPDFGNNVKGNVFTIDIAGHDKKDLFDGDKYAIYLIGWSNAKQQIAYSEGCYACDGGRTAYKLRDIKAKTAKDLIPGVDIKTLGQGEAVSSDLTKVIYVQSTNNSAIKTEGPPGYYSAAPYTIKSLDIATRKTTEYATIGVKNEKSPNGTDKYRQFQVGFINGTNDPYYAEDKGVFSLETAKPNLWFSSDQPLIGVFYVNKQITISSHGKDTSDFLLTNNSLPDKKSTTVLSGDNNTSVFGVTTK